MSLLLGFEVEIRELSVPKLVAPPEEIAKKIRSKMTSSLGLRQKILSEAVANLINSIKKKKYEASFGLFRFVLISGFHAPMDEIRKQGLFRCSKYGFQTRLLKRLIKMMCDEELILSEDQSYLRSVAALLILGGDVYKIHKKISCAVRSRPFFMKTVLARAEVKFSDLFWDGVSSESSISSKLYYENKESIVLAASYLVQVCAEELVDVPGASSAHVDENISHRFYDQLNSDADTVVNFLELEVKVDFFQYEVMLDKKAKNFYVNGGEFELAACHGYVKSELRRQNQTFRYYGESEAMPLYDFLEKIWENESLRNRFYDVPSYPIQRIVIKVLLLEYSHKYNILAYDSVFREEEVQLKILMDENYNSKVLDLVLYDEFTILDILKVQRFFYFASYFQKKVWGLIKGEADGHDQFLRSRSVVAVLSLEELRDAFVRVTGKSALSCEALIKELSGENRKDKTYLDLQYSPLVGFGNRYLIMPTVAATSGLVRSMAIANGVHFSVNGGHDYMVECLELVLKGKGFYVRSNFKFGDDEVDIVAMSGRHLFLFECKNPYHPVNSYELRNTYAHLVKGVSQLKNFENRFKDPYVFKQFLKNLGLDSSSVESVHYAVINANRALTGMDVDGFKIIHANELMSFVVGGEIQVDNHRLCCWSGESFDVADFAMYVSGELLSRDLIDFAIPTPYAYKYVDCIAYSETYQFEIEKLASAQLRRYRKVSEDRNFQGGIPLES